MSRKTILVTGAQGYIATHVIKDCIQKNYHVIALSRSTPKIMPPQVKFYQYDGSFDVFAQIFTAHRIDAVIHLAGHSCHQYNIKDIDALIDVNIKMGAYLLEAMKQFGCKHLIVSASYFQHYGASAGYDPSCLYAAFKEAFNPLIQYYVNACDFKVLTLKLVDVYGPHDPRAKIINLLFKSLLNNTELLLSPGAQELATVYIDDVAQGFMDALLELWNFNTAQHLQYFLADNNYITLKGLAAKIADITHTSLDNIKFGQLPYRDREIMKPYVGVPLPHWQPKISLDEGLKKIVESLSLASSQPPKIKG